MTGLHFKIDNHQPYTIFWPSFDHDTAMKHQLVNAAHGIDRCIVVKSSGSRRFYDLHTKLCCHPRSRVKRRWALLGCLGDHILRSTKTQSGGTSSGWVLSFRQFGVEIRNLVCNSQVYFSGSSWVQFGQFSHVSWIDAWPLGEFFALGGRPVDDSRGTKRWFVRVCPMFLLSNGVTASLFILFLGINFAWVDV
jgi:hypothetical protein